MNQSQQALNYLQKDDIGKVIAKGLASLYSNKPQKPVRYLAQWLKAYSKNKKQFSSVIESQKSKSQNLKLFDQTIKINKLKQQQAQKKAAQQSSKIKQFKKMIANHQYQQQLLEEVLPQFVQKYANITGAYVGELNYPPREVSDEDTDQLAHFNTGAEKVINYIGSSVSHKNLMRGKMLKPNQGITGKVFALVQQQAPPPVAEQGQQPVKQEVKQKFIYIPNVVKNDSIHYFKIPKLGAYLAVPLVCESYLVERIFDEALAAKKKQIQQTQQFNKKKSEQLEQLRKSRQEILKKLNQMKQKHVQQAALEPVNVQLADIDNKIKDKQQQRFNLQPSARNFVKNSYVFCVDNLGKDQQLSKKDIQFIISLVQHFKDSWQKKQQQLLHKDIQTQMQYLNKLPLPPATLKQQLQKTAQLDEQKTKQLSQIQNQNTRNYKQQEQQFNRLKAEIQNNVVFLDSFLILKNFRVLKFRDVIQNILFFLGETKNKVNVPKRATLNWKLVKQTYITKQVFNKILNYVVQGPKDNKFNFYSKTPLLLTIFEKFNEQEIFNYNVGLGALVKFIKKALKHRASNVQLRKQQREQERKERQALIQQNEKLQSQKAEQLKQHKNNLPPEQVEGFKEQEWIEQFDKDHPKKQVPAQIVDDVDNDM